MTDRATWLRQKQQMAVERYDRIFSINYDNQWGHLDSTHVQFVESVIDMTPPGANILDAACGSGKYWPVLLQAGCSVTGIDQSQGMLDNLLSKYPDAQLYRQSLQELNLNHEYAAIICIDAMENVPPEDWPVVLQRFALHLQTGNLLYLTIELPDPEELEEAYKAGHQHGLPVVSGEVALEGYHYYPQEEQVLTWLQDASFQVVRQSKGDGYWHLLCRLNHPSRNI